MTTEDRAYEAAARNLIGGEAFGRLLPSDKKMLIAHAKSVVDAFLTAMGQEVQ